MKKADLKNILTKQALLAKQFFSSAKRIPRMFSVDAFMHEPEILVLTGVRRCGKSLFLSEVQEKYKNSFATLLVAFDDPSLARFEGEDFSLLTELCSELHPNFDKKLLLLDEIQNVPLWEKWLPHIAKDPSIKIIITGSNAKLLSSELATLLTGRHRSFELAPLRFREMVQDEFQGLEPKDIALSDLYRIYEGFQQYGGFPRSWSFQDASILTQYFNDIVERDIIARHGARLHRQVRELSYILCSDNTKLFNRSRLTSQLGVKDIGTIQRYCHWFQESHLFQEIKLFSPSVRKQIRSNPKYYCVDPVLASANAFSVFGHEGTFLENAVYAELRSRGYEIFYWQSDARDGEVDFLCRKPGEEYIGIQVSLTVIDEKTLERELSGLNKLHEELGISRLLLITKNDEERSLNMGPCVIQSIPFIKWALGA